MADDLAALAPPQATAPEHARAVAALRARDAVGYAEAVDELVGAHLAQRDERRTADLLAGLGSDVARPRPGRPPRRPAGPVRAWPGSRRPSGCSPSCPRRTGRTSWWCSTPAASAWTGRCSAPPPRGCWPWPARGPGAGGTTLLGLLYRASALVIRGRSTETPGRVVPLPAGARAVPVPRGEVEQAGA